jgi:hypothetical protein
MPPKNAYQFKIFPEYKAEKGILREGNLNEF